jgi:hypothetical protein
MPDLVAAQTPSVERLECDRVAPGRESAFAPGIEDPLGLEVGQVEELLQLDRGEGPLQRSSVI